MLPRFLVADLYRFQPYSPDRVRSDEIRSSICAEGTVYLVPFWSRRTTKIYTFYLFLGNRKCLLFPQADRLECRHFIFLWNTCSAFLSFRRHIVIVCHYLPQSSVIAFQFLRWNGGIFLQLLWLTSVNASLLFSIFLELEWFVGNFLYILNVSKHYT